MNSPYNVVVLAACLALPAARPAFPQTLSGESTSGIIAVAPVALVYVQTTAGINVYDSAAGGKLTLVKGSPFTETTGLPVGSDGSYFVTMGKDNLHSYKISSTGAIGEQISEISTQSYADANCGVPYSAELDHTGRYVYVLLNGYGIRNSPAGCWAFQTFEIGQYTGALTFKGATNLGDNTYPGIPKIAGNDLFSYTLLTTPPSCRLSVQAYKRESSGSLEIVDIQETNPTQEPNVATSYTFAPFVTDDPTNHLAWAVQPASGGDCGWSGPYQLASYTVSSNGSLTSTNTWENMPTINQGALNGIRMSPSGKLLAVAVGPGVKFYHFNGASPITQFTGILGTSGEIVQMNWDTANHLYAINGESGKLHVYTVTSTGATEAAGSPYVIAGIRLQTLIVVSK